MALGSLLLQPQALSRMQSLDPLQAFGDDLIALLQQILANPEHMESVAPAFQTAFDAMGGRLRTRLEPRLERAMGEIRELIAPLLREVQQIGQRGQDLDSAAKLMDLVAALLERAIGLLESLSEPQLRALSGRVKGILVDTLGLNQAVFKDELREVIRAARAELLRDVDVMPARAAGIHLALAALLGRLEQELSSQLPVFDLNPDRIAQVLFQALRQGGFEKLRARLACLLDQAKTSLGAAGALLDLAHPSPFGAASVGAAAVRPPLSGDKFCWYASWLYASRRQPGYSVIIPGYPADEVWLSEDGTQLILRRAFGGDEVLHESAAGNLAWHEAPQFTTASGGECFTFGAVGPDFLETWTKLFAALAEFGKGVGHIVTFATSPKEYAANIPLATWNLGKSAAMALGEAPLPSLIAKNAGWGVGWWHWSMLWIPWLSVILGSLEGKHTQTNGGNQFLQWLTLLGGDALNAFTLHTYASGAHDVMLSLWTLMNQSGPAGAPDGEDTRPRNREYGDPIIGLAVAGANTLLMKYIIPREDYAHPFQPGNSKIWLWWLVGAPLAGVTGGLVGTLAVWGVSRTYDWAQLGTQIGLGALKATLMFLVQFYTSKEGDTDDGKYNPKLDPDGNDYTPARGQFAGYPAAETSPYLLPYERGVAQFVGQANQGFFSHMRYNWLPQVYAYDFAHDLGDEILASRSGTVVDFFDWVDDDINPDNARQQSAYATSEGIMGAGWRNFLASWNFIIIRHDSQVPDHDRDVKAAPGDTEGGLTTTYAEYGHGKNGSIREVFAARGIAATDIIGSTVQQGQVIMKAGDTGVSFHNHLHMHVRGGPAPPPAPVAHPPPIDHATLTQYTLPFVFREARHVIGRDGVLKYLTWYTSDNEKVD